MFSDLSQPWKRAIEMGWEAFQSKTFPIGAVITNENGVIISEGRNYIHDQESNHHLAGTYMAHAEVSAMSGLKVKEHPEINSYTLYTTMEPCPMCFGTMVMMNIKNLKYGARDSYCGATDIYDTHYYVKNKRLNISHTGGELETYQLTLQTAYEYPSEFYSKRILDSWSKDNSKAVDLGKQLFDEGYFADSIRTGKTAGQVYDYVNERIRSC